MDTELASPVVVDLPLRGEGWMATTTPSHRIPGHGTDLLGQRYAYDFIKVDERAGVHPHPGSTLRLSTIGGRADECYAWGQDILAPFDGEVVRAEDGRPEREWVNPFREAWGMFRTAATFRPDRIGDVLGNHVFLHRSDPQRGELFAVFAHLAPGTVSVSVGDRVGTGDLLGKVGHTGNSTMPHLHFQLMDSLDPMAANGIPCAFRSYEVERQGGWVRVEHGIPGRRDRIRATA